MNKEKEKLQFQLRMKEFEMIENNLQASDSAFIKENLFYLYSKCSIDQNIISSG